MAFVGRKPTNAPLTSSDLGTGIVGSTNIADGAITESKFATGANDDEDIKWDIATLALQQATDANKSAYALPNIFVEQFEDSTGIDVATNTARASSEYVGSIYSSTTELGFGMGTNQSNLGRSVATGSWSTAQTNDSYTMSSSYYDGGFVNKGFDLSKDFTIKTFTVNGSGVRTANPYLGFCGVVTTNTTYAGVNAPSNVFQTTQSGDNNDGFTPSLAPSNNKGFTSTYASTIGYSSFANSSVDGGNANSTINISNTSYSITSYANNGASLYGVEAVYTKSSNTIVIRYYSDTSNNYLSVAGVTLTNVPTTGTFYLFVGDASSGATYFSLTYSGGSGYSSVTDNVNNATGNFTSVSKTAPATVSKASIVVLYKNQSGTATLNTDLIAQVSADNGSNYSTVTLTPRGTFSSGINIATSSAVSVTSGTSCKYKISFANQSSGSKETQVYGVALQY
jgi:hypothetical protein